MKPLNEFGIKYLGFLCTACRKFQRKIDDTKTQNENYYQLINLKFLINEHRRTKIDIEEIEKGVYTSSNKSTEEKMQKMKVRLGKKKNELEINIKKLFTKFEKEVTKFGTDGDEEAFKEDKAEKTQNT